MDDIGGTGGTGSSRSAGTSVRRSAGSTAPRRPPFVLIDEQGIFVDWRTIRRVSVASASAGGVLAALIALVRLLLGT